MTVSSILIEKVEGRGWYRVTVTSLKDSVGETKIELLIRTETLRQFREEADRAINGIFRKNPLDVLNEDENE